MSERKRVWLKVTGRVQGVGFRYFTRREAELLGVVGWVRNTPNGDVEAEAEGISERVDAFIEFVRRGPSASRVVEILVNDLPVLNGEFTFECFKGRMIVDLTAFIRDVPDFPKPGIVFKDITPLLSDAGAIRSTIGQLAQPYRGGAVDQIIGIESRGFIFGAALALELGVGFVPIRKPGKLPSDRNSAEYE